MIFKYFDKEQKTEINQLRLNIEESKAHHEVFIETMRQRQNLENEESAQKYDNLMKTKTRLEVERDEAQHGMETMTRNIEMLTKTKVSEKLYFRLIYNPK